MRSVATELRYEIDQSDDQERADLIDDRLLTFNLRHVPEASVRPLKVYAVDASSRMLGGLVAKMVWGWLEIGSIWVNDELRRNGIGARLLAEAEEAARRGGCTAVRLSTWEFQARDFYLRRGYVMYGRLDNYPAGHTVYYLRKDL